MNIENLNINGFYIISVSVVWILGLIIGIGIGKKGNKQMIIHNPYAKKGVIETEKDEIVDHTGTIVVNVIEEEAYQDIDLRDIADFTFNLTTEEIKKRKDNPIHNTKGHAKAKIKKDELLDINQIIKNDEK